MNKYTVALPIINKMDHYSGIEDHRNKFQRAGISTDTCKWLRGSYSKSVAYNNHWEIMCGEEDLIMLCLLSGARIENHIV